MYAGTSSQATPPVNVTAARTPTRSTSSFEAAPVGTVPDEEQPGARMAFQHLRPGPDQGVLPLAGDQAAEAHHHRGVHRQTEAAPHVSAPAARVEPLRIDTGREPAHPTATRR